MARKPIPTWYFALVVVREGDRFLVVRETKHGQLWYLPAGRVEAGESLVEGALRETLEETGVPVILQGILKFQHTPDLDSARVRVIFLARPRDGTQPKTEPDEHSLEARWVTLEELEQLPLRGPEVLRMFRWVAEGATAYPLELIGSER